MIIGILSDSHGNAAETSRAVALLEAREAKKFVHCGDICSMTVLDELAGRDAVFVWGNCDEPDASLRRYVAAIGLPWPTTPVEFTADGRRAAVFHGHEGGFRTVWKSCGFDYVFYGHTHEFADHRVNGCRFINPGALHRAAVHTVATLDTVADELIFLNVADGSQIAQPR